MLPGSRSLLLCARRASLTRCRRSAFTFSPENFRDPNLPSGLRVIDVPAAKATDETLSEVGACLIHEPDERTVANKNFEIVRWPQPGWRPLDPQTGDEAGTTEGHFDVHWQADYFFGHTLAIATENHYYLDGIGCPPEQARRELPSAGDGTHILLWMSDYHPDGAQLFWPCTEPPAPFTVCLGAARHGDDIRPTDMRAFTVPAGKGVYLAPGTWHNGIYLRPEHCPARFLTRQGKVHARVSCSWAAEFGVLLRVPLGE